jgi:hypothetical protein
MKLGTCQRPAWLTWARRICKNRKNLSSSLMSMPPWEKNVPKKRQGGEVLVKSRQAIPGNPLTPAPIPSALLQPCIRLSG